MSKIYDKYLELKKENSQKMYLFKSGKFYIFIDKDCDEINNYVVLKKVKLTNNVLKCGFPNNSLNDYLRVFKKQNLDIEIIEDYTLNNTDNLYKYIESIDVNKITPLEALTKLTKIKELVKDEKRG